jgi:hypothetical protein
MPVIRAFFAIDLKMLVPYRNCQSILRQLGTFAQATQLMRSGAQDEATRNLQTVTNLYYLQFSKKSEPIKYGKTRRRFQHFKLNGKNEVLQRLVRCVFKSGPDANRLSELWS